MTGGGGYCAGGAGVDISLNGSVVGTNYQLYDGAVAVGSVKAGTGGVLDFGIQFVAGTYSILATNTATGGNLNLSLNIMYLGYKFDTSTYLNGHIRKFAYYPQAVTSAQLQALTGS